MKMRYQDYLIYKIPKTWCVEENEVLTIFDPQGDGALTISFYNFMGDKVVIDTEICVMAKKFIDENKIAPIEPLTIRDVSGSKTVLSGVGRTSDNWICKLWVVAHYPKIILATYLCEKETLEIKKCDAIIRSIKFRRI